MVCTEYSLQDNAALAMIERSSDAWEHNQFKDVIVRAANVEMYVPLSFDVTRTLISSAVMSLSHSTSLAL